MMYKKVDELEPGDRVAQTLKHPRSQIVLITPSFVIDAKTLPRIQKTLRSAGYNMVLIHNPALQILEQYYEAEREDARAKLYQTLAFHCSASDKATLAGAAILDFCRAVRGLCETIKTSKLATAFIELWASGEDDMSVWREKSAERCYLALALALEVKQKALADHNAQLKRIGGQTAPDLGYEDIGIGAMFSDVLDVFGEKTTQSLLQELEQRPFARAVIRQRGQRYDGCGRPSAIPGHASETQLKGDEIHPYSRIAQIASCYSELHVGRPNPDKRGERLDARIPARCLWEMGTDRDIKDAFDPEFLPVFLAMMQPYPIGHKVTLSSGEVGVVIAFEKDSPWCPAVRILSKGGQAVPEPYDIRLVQHPDLRIAKFENSTDDCMTFRG